jgi:hypothetical protein
MSSKTSGVAHRALDEIVKFKTAIITDIGQFKTDVLNAIKDIVKAVREVQEKHNDLAAHISAVEGIAKNTSAFAASEIGKMGGSVQRHLNDLDRSTSAIDVNVLALAELAKELVGQITQIDVLLGRVHSANALELTEEDVKNIKNDAEKWYSNLVASAFKTVRERLNAEDSDRKEKESLEAQKAKEAAEKLAADQSEIKTIEEEIQKANSVDLSVASSASGGGGSTFPDGAEIFGG